MRDFYLEALLKGEITSKAIKAAIRPFKTEKSRFEMALDQHVQEMLDLLHPEEGAPLQIQLISPQMKRKKNEDEIKDIFKNDKLSSCIDLALSTVVDEGKEYLHTAIYETLLADFENTLKFLEHLDLDLIKKAHLPAVKQETLDAIFQIAIAKFEEHQYEKTLSLFVLLTLFKSDDYDYWYRTGIAAQQCENYALAIEAYGFATILNPESLGAYLFSAECNLKLNQREEAKHQYEEAEKIARNIPMEENWRLILGHVLKLLMA